jgi:heat shock protein HslJ
VGRRRLLRVALAAACAGVGCAGATGASPPVDAATPETAVTLVGTAWRWVRLEGPDPVQVPQPGRYTLELHDDGRYEARADCNQASGSYRLDARRLRFGPAAATRAFCGEGSLGERFLALLGDVESQAVSGERLLLALAGSQGTLQFEARRPVPLAGTRWLVRAYDDGRQAVVSTAGATLHASFGEDGNLAGSAGCNRYFAAYRAEGGRLAIGPVGSTQMHCAEPEGLMQQEHAFLAALGRAASWEMRGERLQLRSADGALALDLVSAVNGQVTHRLRRALPPDARVSVRLEDVSRADAPALLLDEQSFPTGGRQVPLPFELSYDPSDIHPRNRYALRAEIRSADGRLLFATRQSHPVLTRDAPWFDVEVQLEPVR